MDTPDEEPGSPAAPRPERAPTGWAAILTGRADSASLPTSAAEAAAKEAAAKEAELLRIKEQEAERIRKERRRPGYAPRLNGYPSRPIPRRPAAQDGAKAGRVPRSRCCKLTAAARNRFARPLRRRRPRMARPSRLRAGRRS